MSDNNFRQNCAFYYILLECPAPKVSVQKLSRPPTNPPQQQLDDVIKTHLSSIHRLCSNTNTRASELTGVTISLITIGATSPPPVRVNYVPDCHSKVNKENNLCCVLISVQSEAWQQRRAGVFNGSD